VTENGRLAVTSDPGRARERTLAQAAPSSMRGDGAATSSSQRFSCVGPFTGCQGGDKLARRWTGIGFCY